MLSPAPLVSPCLGLGPPTTVLVCELTVVVCEVTNDERTLSVAGAGCVLSRHVALCTTPFRFSSSSSGVMLDRIMLKPSMVAPGADCDQKSSAKEVAEKTLKMLNSRVPPCVPGIMFLSG
eukprot:7239201-Pyramimonas_sp.AAC.1